MSLILRMGNCFVCGYARCMEHKQERPASNMRKPGRRAGSVAGDASTRDAIIDATIDLVADLGYVGTSVRAIAARAGVDPALIRHFFGTKDQLLVSAITQRVDVVSAIVTVFDDAIAAPAATEISKSAEGEGGAWAGRVVKKGGVSGREASDPAPAGVDAAKVVKNYLAFWQGDQGTILQALIRATIEAPDAAELIASNIGVDRLGAVLEETRVAPLLSIASELFGVAFLRFAVGAAPWVDIDDADLIARLAPGIQWQLDRMDLDVLLRIAHREWAGEADGEMGG